MLLHAAFALAALTAGLVAGYVLAYSNSVMPGLAEADDRTFVEAARRIIRAVNNPVFIPLSNIPVLALAAAIILSVLLGAPLAVLLLAILALVLYAATLALTFGANVPLNKVLLAERPEESAADLARIRAAFERPWARANAHRTWTATGSAIASLLALLLLAA